MNDAPLIVHLTYVLDYGGLESLMVERINRMPAGEYRHAVISLTKCTDFSTKITKPNVQLFALNKQPGLAIGLHFTLWKLLRALRPAVMHTYNMATMEYAPTALLAGVPVRISGTHGRDASDPDGSNRKHNALRRMLVPFYDCCYSNSADLETWNRTVIGVPSHKSRLLANGIDTEKFSPSVAGKVTLAGFADDSIVIGTVGRIQDVKDHASLVDAFILLRTMLPELQARLRLVIVGEGPLLPALRAKVAAAGIADAVLLPGARRDVANLLRGFDIFAMSSLAEGTPGSALEAMACALPVVGTRVGGIPEVIEDGITGTLVAPADPRAMAQALALYVRAAVLRTQHGAAGRERVLRRYNMSAMVAAYQSLYDSLCERKIKPRKTVNSCVEL